jgi:hypothetical protein
LSPSSKRKVGGIPDLATQRNEHAFRAKLSKLLGRLEKEARAFVTCHRAAIGDSVAEASTYKMLIRLLETLAQAEAMAQLLNDLHSVSAEGRQAAEGGLASIEVISLGLELTLAGIEHDRAA